MVLSAVFEYTIVLHLQRRFKVSAYQNRSKSKSRSDTNKRKGNKVVSGIGKVVLVFIMTLVFLVVACVGVIFILEKGPSETAKTLFVTSCNESSAMGFLSTMFLSQEEVDAIMEKTKMQEVDEGTVSNTDLINVDTDTATDDIEIIDITGGSFKGKLMIIHDPSRVFLGTVSEFGQFDGLTVEGIASRYEGVVGGVNGGDFYDAGSYAYTALPLGAIISNGEVVYNDNRWETLHLAGFTNDNKFFMGNITIDEALEMGVRDAVFTVHETGPFLVMDGEALVNEVPDSATYGGGKNPRTAIGQRADGSVLLMVIDGRQANSLGATFKDLAYVMLEYGAVNACAMDGGTSSQMYYEGEVINNPYSPTGPRKCPTAWLVK